MWLRGSPKLMQVTVTWELVKNTVACAPCQACRAGHPQTTHVSHLEFRHLKVGVTPPYPSRPQTGEVTTCWRCPCLLPLPTCPGTLRGKASFPRNSTNTFKIGETSSKYSRLPHQRCAPLTAWPRTPCAGEGASPLRSSSPQPVAAA